jgi:hypothetical protein
MLWCLCLALFESSGGGTYADRGIPHLVDSQVELVADRNELSWMMAGTVFMLGREEKLYRVSLVVTSRLREAYFQYLEPK